MAAVETKVLSEPVTSAIYDLVRDGLVTQRVEVSDLTEHYLVSLLEAFVRTEPGRLSRALGPELLSTTGLEPALRYVKLKDVADTSLFVSGIFLDHVEAQLPATDYFFEIGSRAYLDLRELDEQACPAGDTYADTYQDLGQRFADFVGVLAYIADKELFGTNEQRIGIYRRWLHSRNRRDEGRLVELGMIPSAGDGKNVH